MPHLIETYATASGFKIDKPSIYENFFPLPFEKYILFHAGSGQPAKNYDYFSEVISMIGKILQDNQYQLLQIGGKDDPQISNTIDLRGKTNFHHTAYLIRRASLLIGNDSCNMHIASGMNTPLIGLYGSTCPKNHGPYFGDKSKQIILESNRKGNKPSFVVNENPKTINLIEPEKVAQSILDLLHIDHKIDRETLFIGPQYTNFVIEVIMDTVVKADFFKGAVLNVRLDYLFNEDILAKNLSIRPLCILTNQPININILKQFRANVALVIYDLDENFSNNFVKEMMEAGIPYQLVSFLEGEKLNQAKLKLFDYGIILKREKITKEKFEKSEKISKLTKWKTNKFLLSDNKMYLNKEDWINKKSINDFSENENVVNLDNPEFFQESDFIYLFN